MLCVVASVLAVLVYLQLTRSRPTPSASSSPVANEATALLARASTILYRHSGIDANYGLLAYVTPASSPEPRFVPALSCESLYVAHGRGICLTADRGVVTTYKARLFDPSTFAVSGELDLGGVPSRSRVSPDGRVAALTVFVSGHGYADVGFSTQTLLLDAVTGQTLADLEKDYSVLRDGKPFKKEDFNFWGVTFTPDGREFYATLSTGTEHLLLRGDIATRTATVIRSDVECPSLSPDGKRVAYKRRVVDGRQVEWQLHVVDLSSGVDRPLNERRSVDDQLEWLDDAHVLYSVPAQGATHAATTDIWAIRVDAPGEPTLLIPHGYSPSVVREPTRLSLR